MKGQSYIYMHNISITDTQSPKTFLDSKKYPVIDLNLKSCFYLTLLLENFGTLRLFFKAYFLSKCNLQAEVLGDSLSLALMDFQKI